MSVHQMQKNLTWIGYCSSEGHQLKLHDGRTYEAKVVGSDEWNDVAVLKISDAKPGDTFQALELGNETRQ